MTLMRFDPFRDLDRFSERVLAGSGAMRSMPMEAFRRGDQFIVALELPGVDPSDVDVTVERNVVTIHAVRRAFRQEGDDVIADERLTGEFSRQLFLGDNLDAGKLAAEFDRGVLRLTIPVAESSRPRRVEITADSSRREQVTTGATSRNQPVSAGAGNNK
jgi:HSP20 family protein